MGKKKPTEQYVRFVWDIKAGNRVFSLIYSFDGDKDSDSLGNTIWVIGDGCHDFFRLTENRKEKMTDSDAYKILCEYFEKHVLNLVSTEKVSGDLSLYSRLIDELGLPVRAYNCLKSEGIKYIGDLIQKSEIDLRNIPCLGRKTLGDIRVALASYGLTIDCELPDGVKKDILALER